MMKKILMLVVAVTLVMPVIAFADGRSEYRANCASCHAASPNSPPDMERAKAMNVSQKKLSLGASEMNRDEMIAITETGKGAMPGYKDNLTKQQIADIVDYIIAVTKKK
jgi:mono/diheme cytochrome c family protein